jgi:hypothetical protein
LILVGIFLILFLWGKVDQVRYLSAEPAATFTDGTLLLRTEPPGLWLIPPNEMFKTLKAGCIYKFRHYTMFCGSSPRCDLQLKWVSQIEYVSCEK